MRQAIAAHLSLLLAHETDFETPCLNLKRRRQTCCMPPVECPCIAGNLRRGQGRRHGRRGGCKHAALVRRLRCSTSTSSSASSAAAFVTPCGWLGIAAADAGVPAGSASAWGSIPRMCGEAWVAVGGGPALLWEPGAGRIEVDAERCMEGAREGEGQQSTPPYSGQWCTQYLRRPAIHAYVSRCARSCKGRMVDR